MAKKAWTSQIDKVVNRMQGDALRSGLKAGGVFIMKIIQESLETGYTSGDFVTGQVAADVKRTRPSNKGISVYTSNPVALAWEMGHFNIYTKKFERIEVWRPAVEQNVEEIRRKFAKRFIEKLNELAHKKLAPAIGI
jgi:hypothetical protein